MSRDHILAPRRRRAAGLSGAAAAMLLLAGCSVWDDYARPDTPKPAAWSTRLDAQAAWPSAAWWRGFGSPRLDALIGQAETANFDIAAAVARVRQADAQLRIAGAALLPTVGGTAGGTRTRSPYAQSAPETTTGPVPAASYGDSFNLGLSASYEIDFWGKNRATEEAARAGALQSRFDARTAQLTVLSSVATTYFDMVGQGERLVVARQTVANAEEVLAAIRDRMEAGLATALDVAQQESVVAGQRATIAPLEQQIRQDANALAILTGRLPEQMAVVPEPLSAIRQPVIEPGLPSALLARRPDVQSAEAALVAANANVGNARAQFFPSIELTGAGGFQSIVLGALLQHTALVWAFGTSLTQPIFEGGRLEGQLEQTKGRYDELLQDYRKAVVSAFSDVENALVAVQKTAEEEAAQRTAEATARNAYEIAEAQLRGGTVDITTVLDTQKTLFAAADALAQARLAHLQAVVGLYKALGGGWGGAPTYPGEKIAKP